MLYFNTDKKTCTGCAACYSVCPQKCIEMQEDEEGYLYPVATDACTHCGACEKVCPMKRELSDNQYKKTAFAAVSKDYDIWKRSASGGAFSEICRAWADEDTMIVGAVWDGMNVHHATVIGYDNIAPLCKSKYISSPIGDTFLKVREHLKDGKKVIFCGCPCQVEGLKSFLKKTYDNLLTIDLICHGQGSPKVFHACMDYLSNLWGERITSYEFRAKRNVYEADLIASITSQKMTRYLYMDPYFQLFLLLRIVRKSCGENCKYHDIKRTGDLTIADCRGLKEMFPDLSNTLKNYSTIVSNSAKGDDLLVLLKKTMTMRECTIDNVIKYNPFFAKHVWRFEHRDEFFADFLEDSQAAIKKWTKPYCDITNKKINYIFGHTPHYVWPVVKIILDCILNVIKQMKKK